MVQSLPRTTVAQLDVRLHEQVLEVATLRLALDIQRHRVAQTLLANLVWPDHRQTLPGIRVHTRAHRIDR